MVARQRHGLHEDLHANLAEAVGQGKQSLRFLQHSDSKQRNKTSTASAPESKQKHVVYFLQGIQNKIENVQFSSCFSGFKKSALVATFAHIPRDSQLSEENAGLSRSHGEILAGFPTAVSSGL